MISSSGQGGGSGYSMASIGGGSINLSSFRMIEEYDVRYNRRQVGIGALRTVRDIVTNIARSTMQEDMDIFRQWYQYLWQLAGEDGKRKQSLLLLLQLSIRYWQNTLPKSSKKQLRFLEDLLQPMLINKEYEELLNVII